MDTITREEILDSYPLLETSRILFIHFGNSTCRRS